MKILVFGKTGQVSKEINLLNNSDIKIICLNREQADLSVPESLIQMINQTEADVVINLAAYTNVEKSEDEEEVAMQINGIAPGIMASECKKRSIPFIHLSTDYVFGDFGKTPIKPDAQASPINSYGRTKLEGERRALDLGDKVMILRTSWVFSSFGNNFVKNIIQKSKKTKELSIVDDQIGGPTYANHIANALIEICKKLVKKQPAQNIFHFSGFPHVSWAEFAEEIFSQIDNSTKIRRIKTKDIDLKASRPFNSRLDCSNLSSEFGIPMSDWKNGLRRVLLELGEIK
tara:strand:- start:825 stop:1688 length:864 start_codon:yes stop_codon:yes gene_type:complete